MMQLNPYDLSFTRDQSHLELDFLSAYFKKYLTHVRVCHLAAIFFLCAWAYIDMVFYTDSAILFLIIKFCIVIPVILLGFLFTFSNHYRRWYQVILVGYVLLVGASFNAMIAITSNTDIYPLVFGITFTYIFNYTFIRSRFVFAVIAGWTLLGLSVLTLLALKNNLPKDVLVSIIYFLAMLNFLGMVICYAMERSSRNEYYLSVRLKEERDNQIVINDQLKNSMEEIKILRGILPICANCKKIRNDTGYWQQVDAYLSEHSEIEFSHGICPDCVENLYPGFINKRG